MDDEDQIETWFIQDFMEFFLWLLWQQMCDFAVFFFFKKIVMQITVFFLQEIGENT